MTKKIIIDGIPPSQNYLLRMHWFKRKKIYDQWEKEIWAYGKIKQVNEKFNKIKIIFYFSTGKKRDLDNYAGFQPLLNGLKLSGLIKDDNYKDVEVSWIAKQGKKEKTEIILQGDENGRRHNKNILLAKKVSHKTHP